MKKRVDSQVHKLLERCWKERHRSIMLIVGDRGKDQVPNLHYILSKIWSSKPSVLWCYKKELGFSSSRKKRMKQLKKKKQKGLFDPNIDDPFELFVCSTRIRYCYYKETDNILGQTFGMCILQDFEALTPNILCRTIETVEGGGVICILLGQISNLKQLYHMTMDSHCNRNSLFGFSRNININLDIEPYFNERFILSITDCQNCLVIDDEFNILPITRSQSIRSPLNSSLPLDSSLKHEDDVENSIESLNNSKVYDPNRFLLANKQKITELQDLQQQLKHSYPSGLLSELAVTIDQSECLLSLIEIISDKKLNTTVSLTAARGRGKSATIGLAIASAIAYSYSNIFITAPHPSNVETIFEFIQKGLVVLGYNEHEHFELIQGTVISDYSKHNSSECYDLNDRKQLVRINIFRERRQTIQYISPTDVAFAKQAEILVIDEAAAIPLPIVSSLLGPYLVFLSSTVNGYEGTGRSLSLKLINDLKRRVGVLKALKESNEHEIITDTSRLLKELSLTTPIRYNANDPVENWLNKLLCLNMTVCPPIELSVLPSVESCRLYEVNRAALFSYHKASEIFLQKLLSLFITSHYKNTPNDILLLSDTPGHHIFVLLPPLSDNDETVPDIIAAVHVCFEGAYTRDCINEGLRKGIHPSGDLLPWTLCQYYIDENFGGLNGMRIVRIAVHPSLQKLGYGTETLRQLTGFLNKKNKASLNILELEHQYRLKDTVNVEEKKKTDISNYVPSSNEQDKQSNSNTTDESFKMITQLRDIPPLLSLCEDKHLPFIVDYIGVSFGITYELLKFYMKLDFSPVYLRQVPNAITGEYSVILLKALNFEQNWLSSFVKDFRKRFTALLNSCFSRLPITVVLYLLCDKATLLGHSREITDAIFPELTYTSLSHYLTSHDILRLERYTQQIIDKSYITDLVSILAWLIFTDQFPMINLSVLQYGVILGLGLQNKSYENIASELNISVNQVITIFNQVMKKVYEAIHKMQEKEIVEGQNSHSDSIKSSEKSMLLFILIFMYSLDNISLTLPGDIPNKSYEETFIESLPTNNESESKTSKHLLKIMGASFLKKYSMNRIDESEFINNLKFKKRLGSISLKVNPCTKDKLSHKKRKKLSSSRKK